MLPFFLTFYIKNVISYYFSLSWFSQDFRHEVNLLVKLRHPNIVQFLGAVTERKPLMLITEYLRGVSECAFVFCFKFNLSPHKFLWVISRNWLKEGIHDRVIFISISRKRVHLVLQQLLTLHWTLPGKSSASKSKIQIALIPHFQLLSNTREEEAGQWWKYFRSFSWFYV